MGYSQHSLEWDHVVSSLKLGLCSIEFFSTMLERATLSLGTTRVTSKVALWAGSSQQGRARRASAAWGRREREERRERRGEERRGEERRGEERRGEERRGEERRGEERRGEERRGEEREKGKEKEDEREGCISF